ncbi:MAG: hypothetical protein ACK56I_37190, partial [bacterium]
MAHRVTLRPSRRFAETDRAGILTTRAEPDLALGSCGATHRGPLVSEPGGRLSGHRPASLFGLPSARQCGGGWRDGCDLD